MSTAREFRDLDEHELQLRLDHARKELFNLRFQVATGRLDNSARVGTVRREIARALSVQREQEIQQAEALGASGRHSNEEN
ncbi:MAG: 50S ribosomal protein L29 [Acidimicrobiales bacterium]